MNVFLIRNNEEVLNFIRDESMSDTNLGRVCRGIFLEFRNPYDLFDSLMHM